MQTIKRDWFIERLEEAKRIARATDAVGRDLCLGCLLEHAGLRGGALKHEADKRFDHFYMTGKKPSHCIYPVKLDRIERIINASIRALNEEDRFHG